MTSFSKWLPGGHIRFFGFWMALFRQRNSSLLWNFSFKFHVLVLCDCRQKPNDCQLYYFKMAALWFWKMFNCNPPIAHCNPLLWGGGILVDHWSTICSIVSTHTVWRVVTIDLVVSRHRNGEHASIPLAMSAHIHVGIWPLSGKVITQFTSNLV